MSTIVSTSGEGRPFMNKLNSGKCLGAADNAMMERSCSGGGTQEPQIRVDAANVMGLRSKGRRIRAG